MKGVLKIFWFYLNFQRVMTWMVYFGLFMIFIVSPVLVYLAGSKVALTSILFALVMVFPFSFMASPWAFRRLISNQRLSLIPNFNISAGIALLLLLVVSIGLSVLTTYLLSEPSEEVPWLFILDVFSFGSLYIGIMQLTPSNRSVAIILACMPITLFFTLQFYSDFLLKVLAYPPFVITFFITSIIGWAYGFYLLGNKNHFTPLAIFNNQWLVGDNSHENEKESEYPLPIWLSSKRVQYKIDSILSGLPTCRSTKIKHCLSMSLIGPLIWSAVVLIFVIDGDTRNSISWMHIFMYGNIAMIAVSGGTNGEFAARARFLWLRTSGNREILWRYVDRAILEAMVIYLGITIALSAFFLLFSPLPFSLIANYPLLALSCYLYTSYLALAARVKQWPGFVTLLVFSISLGLLITAFVKVSTQDNSLYFNMLEALLLVVGLFFRYYAKRNFARINWLEVKPLMRGRFAFQTQGG